MISNSGLSFLPLAGGLISFLAILTVLAIVGVFVIIVVANRADPDPSGRRPQSVYCFAVSFVTIGTSIIGSAIVVESLAQLIGSHTNSITNVVARTSVVGGLITVVSLFLLVRHLRRGLENAHSSQFESNPSLRVGQSYVAAVAFVSVSTLLITTILSIYLVFALAGPGVFGSFGGSTPTIRALIESVYLGIVSVIVLWSHRALVTPALGFLGRSDAAAA